MPFKTEREKQLLEISKAFDDAIAAHDYSKLDGIVSESVVLHKDQVTLREDLTGKQALKQWLQSYSQKYTFQHEVIAGAAHTDNYIFSFWVDKNVTPKPEMFRTELTAEEVTPSNTAGVWHHIVGPESNKIEEIYYLRQLSRDEIKRKLKYDPHYEKLDFDPEKYKHSPFEPSKERALAMHAAVDKYYQIWSTGDVKLADEIMVEDVRDLDLVMGKQTRGREEVKKKIAQCLEKWEPKTPEGHVAVTAGNKGFLFWRSEGKYKDSGEADKLHGIDMMVFDEAAKVHENLRFRVPSKHQRETFVKETVQD